MSCHKYSVRLLKAVILLVAVIETFTDSVIDCIVYTSDLQPSSSILHYYIGAYYLPNKHYYKVIVVLYIPALCFWRVRRGHQEQDAKNSYFPLTPAVFACRQLFYIVLYVGHVPGSAISRALYSKTLQIWLQRLYGIPWVGARLNRKPADELCLTVAEDVSSERVNPSKLVNLVSTAWPSTPDDQNESLQLGRKFFCAPQHDRHNNVLKRYNSKKEVKRDSGNTSNLRRHLQLKHVPKYQELIQQEEEKNRQEDEEHQFYFYKKLPWRWISRIYSRIHGCVLPVWLRVYVIRVYIWVFSCKLEEVDIQDLKHYKNLSEFFRRSLRSGVRPIDTSFELTCPADGTITYCGVVVGDSLEQVKGVFYSLHGFLGPMDTFLCSALKSTVNHNLMTVCDSDLVTTSGNCLYQCVVYLAPGDYHHFHSPADWTVVARRHFPGELYSVHPSITRWLQGIFNFNERATYIGRWKHGFFSMSAVGATLVGSINVYFDETLDTNGVSTSGPSDCFHDIYHSDVRLSKGQAMGDFRLGSTIVLLFEAPSDFEFCVSPGEKVNYGVRISCR